MGANQGLAEGHFVGKWGTQGRNQGFVQPHHTTWSLLKAEARVAVTQQCLETMWPNQSQLLFPPRANLTRSSGVSSGVFQGVEKGFKKQGVAWREGRGGACGHAQRNGIVG